MRTFAIFLSVALLFHGCAIYQREPITAQQAADTHRRILMLDQNDRRVKLHHIEQQNGQLVGIRRGKTVDITAAKVLRPLNRSATTLANIGIAIGAAAVVAVIILAATLDDWKSGGDEPILTVKP